MHETERADMVFGFALKTQKSVNRVLNGLAKIERQFAILGLRLPTGWSKHREAMEKDLALVTDVSICWTGVIESATSMHMWIIQRLANCLHPDRS